jgi:hypothetical protein
MEKPANMLVALESELFKKLRVPARQHAGYSACLTRSGSPNCDLSFGHSRLARESIKPFNCDDSIGAPQLLNFPEI